MSRTPLNKRTLPDYTKGEEIANMVTHTVGGGIGIIITVLSILIAVYHKNIYGLVSVCIYGFSLVSLFCVSSVYHGLNRNYGKKVMQVIDHCTIYFLIAGTYTPILLSAIRPVSPVCAWLVFGIEWGIAAIGVTFSAIDVKKYRVFSMICYIGMGWCIISVLKITVAAITLNGFLWLLAGGIFYTVGAALYVIGAKKKYFHTVFHIFVDIGAVLQGICIMFFVV